MRKIRVMLVDGEAGLRRRIGQALERDRSLEVVATCPAGGATVETFDRHSPDLVVLAIAGRSPLAVEALNALRTASPSTPVLIASPDARKGSPLALDAISHGAAGYVFVEATDAIGPDLAAKIHATLPAPSFEAGPGRSAAPHSSSSPRSAPIEAIVIGSSTGGPDALAAVFAGLPDGLPAPILIVQHFPAGFTAGLSARLDSAGPIRVREAIDGEVVRPGTARVAPIGRHLTLARQGPTFRLILTQGPPVNLCRPSVDVLFGSAARALDGRVLGVVLTGMDRDGVDGAREIRAAGGTIVVQDEATSVVWGMPGRVAEAGLAHKVLPLGEIGLEIARVARAGRSPRSGPGRPEDGSSWPIP